MEKRQKKKERKKEKSFELVSVLHAVLLTVFAINTAMAERVLYTGIIQLWLPHNLITV